ncbi:copper resistance protein [Elasticomyces elasticus]|nr:copper resistance protein [Elasticomyces elasticus]
MRVSKSALALASAASTLPNAVAQTSTDCNPTEKVCPADTGLDSTTYTADFTSGPSANASWSAAAYTTINYGSQGVEFTISKSGQAPTIQTDFYIFFGRVEVKMKAATGTGIVSSIVLQSDDLDEIDWEFLGGNTAQAETNYFDKGNTTTYDRAIYYPVSAPQATFHTYTVDWTSSRLVFYIDGTAVRTLNYADANGGATYPQTPMRLKLGNWAGGAAGEPAGTVAWAGGQTDFSKGPFTMYVESVSITNYNPGSSYEYTDMTGSYKSIKVVKGMSTSNTTGTATAGSGSSAGTYVVAHSNVAAPTSSLSVAPIKQTAAAVSITLTGSERSPATESISTETGVANSAAVSSMNTPSIMSASTDAPAIMPSGYATSMGATTSSTNSVVASVVSSSTSPAVQTSVNAVSRLAISGNMVLGLAGVLISFCLL